MKNSRGRVQEETGNSWEGKQPEAAFPLQKCTNLSGYSADVAKCRCIYISAISIHHQSPEETSVCWRDKLFIIGRGHIFGVLGKL